MRSVTHDNVSMCTFNIGTEPIVEGGSEVPARLWLTSLKRDDAPPWLFQSYGWERLLCDHGPPNVQVLNLLVVERNVHKQCHYYLYFCMLNKTYFVFQDRSERHTGEYWGILLILQPWTMSGVNLVYLINLAVQHFFLFLYIICNFSTVFQCSTWRQKAL